VSNSSIAQIQNAYFEILTLNQTSLISFEFNPNNPAIHKSILSRRLVTPSCQGVALAKTEAS
jgi:hypothetical protein